MDGKKTRFIVRGRVQGVLFRDAVRSFCLRNGIKGYVRNKKDGSVEIVASASQEKRKKLEAWLNSSPGLSKVERVYSEDFDFGDKYEDFEIRYEDNIFVDKSKAIVNLGKRILGLEEGKIPVHVAIIPDGNRRWAREKGMKAAAGHYTAGSADNLRELIEEARRLGIKYISVWGFSTENWNRNQKEVEAVFNVVSGAVKRMLKESKKNKIRFRHFGRRDRLPKKLIQLMERLEKETERYSDFNINFCIDYGGRDEILRAVNKLLKSGKKDIDEEEFRKHLDTSGVPDPDLIIRTSGERRTSGLMPFQSDYAELHFVDKYFPDFKAIDLRRAVEEYGRRVRRFGGTNKKDLEKKQIGK